MFAAHIAMRMHMSNEPSTRLQLQSLNVDILRKMLLYIANDNITASGQISTETLELLQSLKPNSIESVRSAVKYVRAQNGTAWCRTRLLEDLPHSLSLLMKTYYVNDMLGENKGSLSSASLEALALEAEDVLENVKKLQAAVRQIKFQQRALGKDHPVEESLPGSLDCGNGLRLHGQIVTQGHVEELSNSMDVDAEEAQMPYSSDMICPLTHLPMAIPVLASDGHSYEKHALLKLFDKTAPISPLTREKLAFTCYGNRALCNLIQGHTEKIRHALNAPKRARADVDMSVTTSEPLDDALKYAIRSKKKPRCST